MLRMIVVSTTLSKRGEEGRDLLTNEVNLKHNRVVPEHILLCMSGCYLKSTTGAGRAKIEEEAGEEGRVKADGFNF